MYKRLLNKGFQPVYYTNSDFLTVTSCKSRLCYRLKIENIDLLSTILNVINKFDTCFTLLIEPDLIAEFEIDDDLDECWLYFYNTEVDNFEISKEDLTNILEILPNRFIMEHKEW